MTSSGLRRRLLPDVRSPEKTKEQPCQTRRQRCDDPSTGAWRKYPHISTLETKDHVERVREAATRSLLGPSRGAGRLGVTASPGFGFVSAMSTENRRQTSSSPIDTQRSGLGGPHSCMQWTTEQRSQPVAAVGPAWRGCWVGTSTTFGSSVNGLFWQWSLFYTSAGRETNSQPLATAEHRLQSCPSRRSKTPGSLGFHPTALVGQGGKPAA